MLSNDLGHDFADVFASGGVFLSRAELLAGVKPDLVFLDVGLAQDERVRCRPDYPGSTGR